MSFESNPDRQSLWSRPRWYELLPELLLAAGLMFFLIDEPDAATSAFKSNRAVGLMAAAAVLWIAGRVVLARFLHARVARTALFGLAGLGVLAVVVVPAYLNETVVEAFPLTSAPADAETIVPTPSSPPTTASTAPASTAPASTAPASTART